MNEGCRGQEIDDVERLKWLAAGQRYRLGHGGGESWLGGCVQPRAFSFTASFSPPVDTLGFVGTGVVNHPSAGHWGTSFLREADSENSCIGVGFLWSGALSYGTRARMGAGHDTITMTASRTLQPHNCFSSEYTWHNARVHTNAYFFASTSLTSNTTPRPLFCTSSASFMVS